MAGGLFSNSKTTLIFAGGVIGAAALFAGFLAPAYPVGSAQESEPPAEERIAKAEPNSDQQPAADNPEFGEFAGFADDAELIDETEGFDPTPDFDSDIVLPEPNTPSAGFGGTRDSEIVDDDDDEGAPAPRAKQPKTALASANQQLRRPGVRPQDLSVEQMKRRLATPPRVSNAGE